MDYDEIEKQVEDTIIPSAFQNRQIPYPPVRRETIRKLITKAKKYDALIRLALSTKIFMKNSIYEKLNVELQELINAKEEKE